MVIDFIERFELVSSQLRHNDDEMLRGALMNGLKESFKAEVCLYGTVDLGNETKMARRWRKRVGDGPRLGCDKKIGLMDNLLTLKSH